MNGNEANGSAAVALADAGVGPLKTDADARERIPGSPLVPGCVAWAEDGRVAVVSDASIMVATFMSRELEMYQQQSPVISKGYVFLPESTARERVPVEIPVFNEPTDAGLPTGSATYFLLNEGDRHQNNPKELSLSKNGGGAFLSAVWGPRGSGPNSSCALLALTASSRISLHFPPSFHMNWKEAAVFSETLFDFFNSQSFRLTPSHDTHNNQSVVGMKMDAPAARGGRSSKKRRCCGPSEERIALNSIAEYTHKCAMLSTLTMAWSPFLLTADKQNATSLIAFSGRKVSTIWAYAYPTFASAMPTEQQRFLSPVPIAWIDTDKHGWVSTSTWQQMHRQGTEQRAQEHLGLALGTVEGKVLLADIPIRASAPDGTPCEVVVNRVVTAPHSQPVFSLCMGSRWTYDNSPTNDLIVASGSTISVWNLKKKRLQPKAKWKAHDGNVTGIDINYFGDTIFSCAVDGTINVWEKDTGKQLLSSNASVSSVEDGDSSDASAVTIASSTSKYPIFGLAMSPSSAQLACVYIIPPAARPNRKSQADVSYSRVSSALEYIPSPWVKSPEKFVDIVCRILDDSRSVSNFTDVVWFCHDDNAAITSLQGSSDMTIPNLLNKLKGVSGEASDGSVLSRQPLYLSLCEALEKRYYDSIAADNSTSKDAADAFPLFLQASFLLRSAITPADHQVAVRDAALVRIRRTLGVYWAERCLKALLASSKKADQSLASYLAESSTERISALVMADFLSVQDPLTRSSEAFVTQIYTQLGSGESIKEWTAFLQARANDTSEGVTGEESSAIAAVRVPPARETCFICDKAVPFAELETACEAGHALERCFLSFRVISAMEVWKCMGCGASAGEIDLSNGTPPFYLLDAEAREEAAVIPAAAGMKIICRLCGNFCSFSQY
ncbi:hypothetical protein BBJ28_00020968 [Nothophytophthora sp. Chile5]|nr:hypothetical protein BBJ28_00020968 [Nothophytophthora sp. Chile5]